MWNSWCGNYEHLVQIATTYISTPGCLPDGKYYFCHQGGLGHIQAKIFRVDYDGTPSFSSSLEFSLIDFIAIDIYRVSLKTKTAAAPVKHKPRSRSVEPRKHEKVEEPSATATTRQRRERIAARTAKVASDGGDAHSWETSKPTRSTSSPPVAKSSTASKETSSAKPIPPSKSAFGSSISRTTDGKSRVEPIKDKEEIKSTTQITRRTKSSRELTKERKMTEQEPLKVLSRSRSDSRLVPSPAERASSPEHSSKSKGSADVVVLCSKKATGRIDRVSDERARSTVPFVDKVGSNNILREEFKIEEHKEEQSLSTASSRIECQDDMPDTSPMRAPIVVLSPPFSLSESWKLKPKRHIAERASDELLDRHKSRAESTIKRTQSDPLHYRGSRSGVSPDSRHQLDEVCAFKVPSLVFSSCYLILVMILDLQKECISEAPNCH